MTSPAEIPTHRSGVNWKQGLKHKTFFIEDVITKNQEVAEPCLVKFSNGDLSKTDSIIGTLYRNNSEKYIRRRKERILKVSNNRICYFGKNFGENNTADLKERTFLGILDKTTGKMKLVEMSNFTLHPHLEESEPLNNSKLMDSQLTYNQKQKNLSDGFGGRKSRTMVRKRAENEIDMDDMAGTMMDALGSIEPTDISAILERKNPFKDILPPCNREVSNVNEVYPLELIVPIEDLLYFNDIAVEYLDAEEIDENSHSQIFLETLAKAKFIEVESEQVKIICIALYIEQIITLLKMKPEVIKKKKYSWHSCPIDIQQKLFATFTEGKDRVKTKPFEDKMAVYIIILALIANNYEVQWKSLSHSLGIQKERLENLIRVTGATFRKDAGVVALQLPLTKLNLNRPKRKRK